MFPQEEGKSSITQPEGHTALSNSSGQSQIEDRQDGHTAQISDRAVEGETQATINHAEKIENEQQTFLNTAMLSQKQISTAELYMSMYQTYQNKAVGEHVSRCNILLLNDFIQQTVLFEHAHWKKHLSKIVESASKHFFESDAVRNATKMYSEVLECKSLLEGLTTQIQIAKNESLNSESRNTALKNIRQQLENYKILKIMSPLLNDENFFTEVFAILSETPCNWDALLNQIKQKQPDIEEAYNKQHKMQHDIKFDVPMQITDLIEMYKLHIIFTNRAIARKLGVTPIQLANRGLPLPPVPPNHGITFDRIVNKHNYSSEEKTLLPSIIIENKGEFDLSTIALFWKNDVNIESLVLYEYTADSIEWCAQNVIRKNREVQQSTAPVRLTTR
jgi:hypothetical protein